MYSRDRKKKLKIAIDFLINSIEPKGGSRAFYSRLYHPLKGWSNMYPETTGYIIPTFINIGKTFKRQDTIDKAMLMADWLLSIQNKDGSFISGLYNKRAKKKSIFNSAQIIIGLVNAYKFTNEEKYLNAAINCGQWIVGSQNKQNGMWDKYNYVDNFTPSYFTRVAWPLLMIWEITKDEKLKSGATLTLDAIYKKKLENGFIKDSGFQPSSIIFTHTIAYTIRGFYESAQILNDKKYEDIAVNLSEKFLKKYELNSFMPGAFTESFKGINSFECLTGHAQLAIMWLKIHKRFDDLRYLNASLKILDRVSLLIPSYTFIKRKGGVPGSYPFWGKYMIFRQPNWATKFFIDAILLENESLKSLKKSLSI